MTPVRPPSYVKKIKQFLCHGILIFHSFMKLCEGVRFNSSSCVKNSGNICLHRTPSRRRSRVRSVSRGNFPGCPEFVARGALLVGILYKSMVWFVSRHHKPLIIIVIGILARLMCRFPQLVLIPIISGYWSAGGEGSWTPIWRGE